MSASSECFNASNTLRTIYGNSVEMTSRYPTGQERAIFSLRLWCPRRRRERHLDLINDSAPQFPSVLSNNQPRQPKSASLSIQPVLNYVESITAESPIQSAGSTPALTSSVQLTIGNQQRQRNIASIKFGLLNAQSVSNKFTAIHSEIIDRNTEACSLTESWHSTGNDAALNRCVPPGYALYEVARKSGGTRQNHSGVAAIVSSNLKFCMIHSTISFATFESMAFTLSSETSTVAVLLMCRPGSQKVTIEFFNEVTPYLEAMSTYTCQLVIAGDLNINVADSNCRNASRLIDLFTSVDCVQKVAGETQVRGGILDHVVTRSSDAISDFYVGPPRAISDHSLITWTLPFFQRHPIAERKALRSWKRVDRNRLRHSILNSELCAEIPQTSTAEYLFDTCSA